ncbi:uncharacterized protein LOC110854985 [Folsomia candida]|uniref:Chitin-binding type-4 domain-containing protein n=1 Tax=Folsomia candida TaxID=158441 RepID=A0A226DV57_FOLCA|nr:uncharacterized protein LOC110854985 [Folsomia candida]OXA48908.1 hypothetical protein Fcan01_16754 [Folsomia candida]
MTPLKVVGAVCLILGVMGVGQVSSHGRVLNPPTRGSLWREPEYAWANPGHQADDQELLCGGRDVTDPYVGACGLCGDSLLDPRPRKHEIGGEFDRGLIVRNYTVGQTIPIEIVIAVDHRGWHEFRLCPYSETGVESEECFNRHLLRFGHGSTRELLNGQTSVVLPAGVTCSRCVLQWSWFGEGSNQYYRNCMDISIR